MSNKPLGKEYVLETATEIAEAKTAAILSNDEVADAESTTKAPTFAAVGRLLNANMGTILTKTVLTDSATLTLNGAVNNWGECPSIAGNRALGVTNPFNTIYFFVVRLGADGQTITALGPVTWLEGDTAATLADEVNFYACNHYNGSWNTFACRADGWVFQDEGEEPGGDVVPDPANLINRTAMSKSGDSTYTATGDTTQNWEHFSIADRYLPEDTAGWCAFRIAASPNNSCGLALKDDNVSENYGGGNSRMMIIHHAGTLSSIDNYGSAVANGGSAATGDYVIWAREYIGGVNRTRLFKSTTPADRDSWIDTARGDFGVVDSALYLAGHILAAPHVMENVITHGFVLIA